MFSFFFCGSNHQNHYSSKTTVKISYLNLRRDQEGNCCSRRSYCKIETQLNFIAISLQIQEVCHQMRDYWHIILTTPWLTFVNHNVFYIERINRKKFSWKQTNKELKKTKKQSERSKMGAFFKEKAQTCAICKTFVKTKICRYLHKK